MKPEPQINRQRVGSVEGSRIKTEPISEKDNYKVSTFEIHQEQSSQTKMLVEHLTETEKEKELIAKILRQKSAKLKIESKTVL